MGGRCSTLLVDEAAEHGCPSDWVAHARGAGDGWAVAAWQDVVAFYNDCGAEPEGGRDDCCRQHEGNLNTDGLRRLVADLLHHAGLSFKEDTGAIAAELRERMSLAAYMRGGNGFRRAASASFRGAATFPVGAHDLAWACAEVPSAFGPLAPALLAAHEAMRQRRVCRRMLVMLGDGRATALPRQEVNVAGLKLRATEGGRHFHAGFVPGREWLLVAWGFESEDDYGVAVEPSVWATTAHTELAWKRRWPGGVGAAGTASAASAAESCPICLEDLPREAGEAAVSLCGQCTVAEHPHLRRACPFSAGAPCTACCWACVREQGRPPACPDAPGRPAVRACARLRQAGKVVRTTGAALPREHA